MIVASMARVVALAWSEIRMAWKRPLYIVFFLILALMSLGFVLGNVQIRTGSVDTGGAKAWINSEFNLAYMDIVLLALVLPFFAAVAAGMTVLADEDRKLDRILHATPLSFREYALARFLGAVVPIALVLLAWMVVQMGVYELWPLDNAKEVRGPFDVMHYLRPLVLFGGTLLVFSAGVSMYLGTSTRQPALVFALPTVMLFGGAFFLWDWSPEWLAESINRVLQWIDPAGMRWMRETYIEADRGAGFYNHAAVVLDWPFALSRMAYVALGLVSIPLVARSIARRVRGRSPAIALASIPSAQAPTALANLAASAPLPESTQSPPGLVTTTITVLRSELRALLRSPGLWIFGPLILLQVIGTSIIRPGALDTIVLATSGTIAAGAFNTLTLLLTLLILYYTVESLVREERHNVAKIIRASPAPTAGMLAGKVLANAAMCATIILAAFIAALIVLLVQAMNYEVSIAPELGVFGLLWIVLLAPTLIVWSAFVALLFALVRNRYATYALAMGVLILTGFLTLFGYMNWASRWHLWSLVRWSDLDRLGYAWTWIVWNRVLVLALAVFFIALTLRVWPRRTPDARGIVDRMQAGRALRSLWVPAVAGLPALIIALGMLIAMRNGSEGGPQERAAKDYWRKNSATWENAPVPALDRVTADVELFPETRSFHVQGTYALRNASDKPMIEMPLTVREHLDVTRWTIDGLAVAVSKIEDDSPAPRIQDHARLFVFKPKRAVEPGATLEIGFEITGDLPRGWTKRTAGAGEFILPSGVVLTSFTGSFLPLVGFSEGVGVDEKNQRDSKDYPDDRWKERCDPLFGPAWATQMTMTVTAPSNWTVNAVGVPGEPREADGRTTITWTTDQPVRFFNLVGGPLIEKRGLQSSIYYDPRHAFNVDRMSETLDHARTKYAEWFHPYPWKLLRLTEFAGLADYAQGFPGNISFSEGIGFLTRRSSKGEADAVEFVVAHESAHQWWGNILTPGKGPGGNVLSEGMANFSAAMLIEDLRGNEARKSLMRRFEDQYGNGRSADSERPLNKIDGSRTGDGTVTYDRGGWVFWMLKDFMGRAQMLAGLQEFITRFKDGPDYPLVEDLMTTLREFADDGAAFDAFTHQWVFGKALPEFKLSDVKATKTANVEWTVTGTVTNSGTGSMTVEVGAFGAKVASAAKDGSSSATEPSAAPADEPSGKPSGGDAGGTEPIATGRVTLTPGASATFTIACPFIPMRVDVDPDVRVLQLDRKHATSKVSVTE